MERLGVNSRGCIIYTQNLYGLFLNFLLFISLYISPRRFVNCFLDDDGNTPLHMCANMGHIRTAKVV